MLGCRPVDRWEADRDGMLPLRPVAPVVGWRCRSAPTATGWRCSATADRWPGMTAAGPNIRASPTTVDDQVERRPLSDYDRMFGLYEAVA